MTGTGAFSTLMMRIGAWALLAAVITGCASGPRYGAQRKKKKGCDCPHWNWVPKHTNEVHAATMRMNGTSRSADGTRH